MALYAFTLEDKIAVLESEINEARKFRREPGSAMQRHYEVLKSIAADLRGRQELPRSNALGHIQRAIDRAVQAKTSAPTHDPGRLVDIGNAVISKWPTVRQALEQFGEESAE